ncbi:MAG: hypothetical protein DRP12_01950 [Candidatus Aenigmatarchaeota archaeon]|nr:MAG: hypothetical protein DRP12_01950 [Candidatus Aenigmarchaeota archaeon]
MPKILLVIAPEGFRDEEYFDTKAVLEAAGVETETASKTPGEKQGMLGGKAKAELGLGDVKPEDYDGIVWVGGVGAQVYFDDERALELAKSFYQAGKLVAAICIAPVILANAGLLKGRKATCWNGKFREMLLQAGADFQEQDVVRDGKLVTANGPHAAKSFAEEILKAL